MIVLECCRLIFYLIEWIWTTVVLGIFRDKLIITEELTNGETSPACLFNLNLGTSRCDFGVAWAAIAFVVITTTIIWNFLDYCTAIRLPSNVETVIFAWLAIWWGVGAIAMTAVKDAKAPSSANVPVVFAWMLFILSGISAYIASHTPKPMESRGSETENVESSSY